MKPLIVALMAALPFSGVLVATAYADDVTNFITVTDDRGGAGAYYSAEELDRLLAPIALYQDALLAQILMASTYPLEVVEAARWSRANSHLRPEDVENAMQQKPWDPSVKSLTAVPQVLEQMNENLEWTRELGDAFLLQQQDVMNTVQALRNRALAAGNLSSNDNLLVKRVISSQGNVIVIESPQPDVIYIPSYNPTVIYGPWWYPSPPYYIYPSTYVYPTGMGFVTGIAVGAAIWGGFNWGYGNVNINVNRYNNYNHTSINNGSWHHDPYHRRGVDYRGDYNSRPYNRYPDNHVNQPHQDFHGNDGRNSFNGDRNGDRSQPAPGVMPHQPPEGRVPNNEGQGAYRPPQHDSSREFAPTTPPQGFQQSPGSYPHQGGRPVQGDQPMTTPQYPNRGQAITPPPAMEQGGGVQPPPHSAYPGFNNSGGTRTRSPQETPSGTMPQYQNHGQTITPAPTMQQQGGAVQPQPHNAYPGLNNSGETRTPRSPQETPSGTMPQYQNRSQTIAPAPAMQQQGEAVQPQPRNVYPNTNNAGDSSNSGGRGQFNQPSQPGMNGGNSGGRGDYGHGGFDRGDHGGGGR
jgi:hypothetical protein